MGELYTWSAKEIADALRRKEVQAIEVAEAHLSRCDAINPSVNAVVEQDRDATMTAARAVDAQIAAGAAPGALAGVPCTTKVNVDQTGFATTNGLRRQKDLVAKTDNPVVANMQAAGAVIVGRTNTPAFSMRWFTKNDLHGQTLNPRNPDVTPGGSSGGAAASVAAGICAVAHGTDIAGSIRYPAFACGIHGIRPSLGRVPAQNATAPDRFIGAQLMAVSGPMARTIGDLELAFRAMSAPDFRDPWQIPPVHPGYDSPKRAALCLQPDGMSVAQPVKTALTDAANALEEAGWDIEEVPCPPMREPAEINALLWMAEMQMASKDALAAEGEADSVFVYDMMRRLAGPVDLTRIMTALQRRVTLMREWGAFLDTYPVLICPISGELPFDQQSDVRSEADFERIYDAQLTQRGLPALGLPGLAVATGAAEGRPNGVQLVAAPHREDVLFAAGRVIEAASPPVTVAERFPFIGVKRYALRY